MSTEIGTETPTGWMRRFNIAVQTRRRIVLYGNVMDLVREGAGRIPLIEWLQRYLGEQHGFGRIIRYNFGEEPHVLLWDDPGPPTPQEVLRGLLGGPPQEPGGRTSDPANPTAVLRALGTLLHEQDPEGPRTAVVLENFEHRVSEPSLDAVLMRQLVRERADRTPSRGLVIHLYTSESQIPRDFFTADADIGLILVVTPDYSDRLQFFEQLDETEALRQTRERGAEVSPQRLARITEGYRLRELDQLQTLARAEGPGLDLSALLSLFRHGRKVDHWANLDIADARRLLEERVKGQDGAVEQVVRSIFVAKHNVGSLIDGSVRTPAMVIFFVGATGVGKTLMARTICEAITGTEENLKLTSLAADREKREKLRCPKCARERLARQSLFCSCPHQALLVSRDGVGQDEVLELYEGTICFPLEGGAVHGPPVACRRATGDHAYDVQEDGDRSWLVLNLYK